MNDELLEFIRRDCQLPGLAQSLHPLVHQHGSLSGFVSRILAYTGLYDQETLQQVEETLRDGSGLSDYEKQKLQADRLVEQKRYEEALKGYDRLLERIRDNQEMEVPALPEQEKETLEVTARKLQNMEREYEDFTQRKNRMDDALYYQLKNRESELEEGIRRSDISSLCWRQLWR